MVPQQVSFVERSSLSQRVPYWRFHCISLTGMLSLHAYVVSAPSPPPNLLSRVSIGKGSGTETNAYECIMDEAVLSTHMCIAKFAIYYMYV